MGEIVNDDAEIVSGVVAPLIVSVIVRVPGAVPVVTVIVADVAELTLCAVMLAPVPPDSVKGEPVQLVLVPVNVNT